MILSKPWFIQLLESSRYIQLFLKMVFLPHSIFLVFWDSILCIKTVLLYLLWFLHLSWNVSILLSLFLNVCVFFWSPFPFTNSLISCVCSALKPYMEFMTFFNYLFYLCISHSLKSCHWIYLPDSTNIWSLLFSCLKFLAILCSYYTYLFYFHIMLNILL